MSTECPQIALDKLIRDIKAIASKELPMTVFWPLLLSMPKPNSIWFYCRSQQKSHAAYSKLYYEISPKGNYSPSSWMDNVLVEPASYRKTHLNRDDILILDNVTPFSTTGVVRDDELEFLLLRHLAGENVAIDTSDRRRITFHRQHLAAAGLAEPYWKSAEVCVEKFELISLTPKGYDILRAARSSPTREERTNLVQHFHGGVQMGNGDQFNVSGSARIGIAGGTHTDTNAEIDQSQRETRGANAVDLATELKLLRVELLQRARTPEDYTAIGHVASAEKAAANGQSGEASKALAAIGSAGKWVLDVAKELSVSIASETIKRSLYG